MRPTALRCEDLIDPLGVGTPAPRFAWEVEPSPGCGLQQAWRIQLWDDPGSGPRWDSGRTTSAQQCGIAYAGPALAPRSAYRWRVMLWGADGAASDWSPFARCETGIFSLADWDSPWLAYEWAHLAPERQSVNHLRREFSVDPGRPLRRARIYVAATAGPFGNHTLRMNLYQVRLNGERVGEDLLNPGQLSACRERALVRTLDATALLRAGGNAIGLIHAAARISFQVLIEHQDGGVVLVGADRSCHWNLAGPFLQLWRHDVYEYGGKGEVYDAREEFPGWDRPGFDERGWRRGRGGCRPPAILAAQLQSARVVAEWPPVRVERRGDGRVVVDAGRVVNGHLALRLRGPRATRATMTFAEALGPDGEPDPRSTLSSQGATSAHRDIYVKRGDGPEDYAPSFANHGFRWAVVEGLAEPPAPGDLRVRAVRSAVEETFRLALDDPWLQRLYALCAASLGSNLMSVPTDCPSRERQGWLGDHQACVGAGCALFDLRDFHRKWFDDIADEQGADGSIPYIAPFPMPLPGTDLPWSTGFLTTAWESYQAYGDPAPVRHHLPAMRRWAQYVLSRRGPDGVVRDAVNYGDHLGSDGPDHDFLGTVFACRSLDLFARLAAAAGDDAAAAWASAQAVALRTTIDRQFRHREGYGNGSQCANALALDFDLVPAAERAALLRRLAADVHGAGRLTTGILGTTSLVSALGEGGHDGLLLELMRSRQPGTWGGWLARGETMAPEGWAPGADAQATHAHAVLAGGLAAWFVRRLAGIAPLSPGYGAIRIRPFLPAGVQQLESELRSVRGTISVRWQRQQGTLAMEVGIPGNTGAEIHLPVGSGAGCDIHRVGPGRSRFTIHHPSP